MANYSVGKILNVNNIDFCILSIIEYKNNTYILAMESVEHVIPEHPKIILLKDIGKKEANFGSHFEIIHNKSEIENVLKNIKI